MHVNFKTAIAVVALVLTAITAASADEREDWLRRTMPARWSDDSSLSVSLPSDDQWWKGFNDPLLDSLIYLGETNNFNLSEAARRVEIARLSMKQAQSGYYPTVGVSGGWTKARTSGARAGHDVPATNSSFWGVSADMSWEIDLFGRVRARSKEGRAQWQASRAEYASAMISVVSEIASDYIMLRVYQAELAVTRAHIESQDKIVKIVEAREEAGIGNMLEVSQSRTVYNSTIALLPSLETSIASTINAITLLCGVEPGSLDGLLGAHGELPQYHGEVTAGLPMNLLRRRPDVVAAEYQIENSAAALGIARKDYLPTLSLTGSIGTSAHSAKDMFKNNALDYSIAPTLSWTVFDGLTRKYNVASARETMQANIDAYNLTVMTAYTEVQNAIVSYNNARRYIDDIDNVVKEAANSLKYSVALYKDGLSQFYNVVEAETSVLNYDNSLIQARGQALIALVDLYKAIGGGWTGLEQ